MRSVERDRAKGHAVSDADGARSVYDLWLGLLPQFFARIGAGDLGAFAMPAPAFTPPFPSDQVARAARMTQEALQALARAYAPMLDAAGAEGLFKQWASTMPLASTLQAPSNPPPAIDPVAMTAWMSVGGAMQVQTTTFERTFGGLSDALGFGPMRKLQAAGQELVQAAFEQNNARIRYATLVQGAFAAGLEALLARLAAKAQAGERVDSVLALLRLWAVCAEDAVHEVLQSEQGLAATAAVARAGLAHRRKLQDVASIVADALDLATRRDLDEAYREIQELKRELRRLRPPVVTGGEARSASAQRKKRKPA